MHEKRALGTFLITGSTGSVGRAFLMYALAQGMQEIWISSRDEFKQEVMRKELYDSPVKYYLGDVRDRASVDPAMERVDCVFRAPRSKRCSLANSSPSDGLDASFNRSKESDSR